MRTTRWMTVLVAVLAAVAACSAAGPSTAASSTPPAGGQNPVPPPAASSTPTPSPTLANADPCGVLTQAEASALSRVTMPAGMSQPWGTGGAVKCGYTSGSVEAFVIIEKAASADAAQAAWNTEKVALQQQAQPAGVAVTATAVPGLGDQAELFVGTANVGGFSNTMMAIFVLKGATFLDLGDFALKNATPPTTDALKAQAETSAGRI